MEPDILKELQALQALYKSNFDLVSSKVEKQADLLATAVKDLEIASDRHERLAQLLKDVIAEKDVQIQRLIKAVAALTVIADQLTERFQRQQ